LIPDVRAADLQEEMAEQRFSVPSASTKTAAPKRTSQRAEASNQAERDARAGSESQPASVGNRAPTIGGTMSEPAFGSRRATTTSDFKRDCASSKPKQVCGQKHQ
jgi:hypothetical protein